MFQSPLLNLKSVSFDAEVYKKFDGLTVEGGRVVFSSLSAFRFYVFLSFFLIFSFGSHDLTFVHNLKPLSR